MSEESTPPPSEPSQPDAPHRSPDSIDIGCMVGLAMILVTVPVSLFAGAPLAVLGIMAAALAWGMMRLTPLRFRSKFGYGKIWLLWFVFVILLEIGVAVWIHHQDKYGGEFTERG